MMLLLVSFVSLFLLSFSACPLNSLSGSCIDSTYSLMIDGKTCYAYCPSKFTKVCTTTGGSTICTACSLPTSPILFQLNCWTVQDLTKNYIANAINPSEHWLTGGSSFSTTSKYSPLPTIDRGFYFAPLSTIWLKPGDYAAPYFTVNMWIHPLAEGIIFTYYYSGHNIECFVGPTTFTLKVLLMKSSDSSQTRVTAYSSAYTSAWQTLSFQLEQASCNQVNLRFYINSSPTVTSFNNYEANFPKDSYSDNTTWKIGRLTGDGNPTSFEGFLYWIEARNDLTIYYPAMQNQIDCIDNQYWDGTSCQNCNSNCSSWPWCRRGDDCSFCNTVSCGSCKGYAASMCTSCTTGSLPYCCDFLASACTATWQSTSCTNGINPVNGVCLYGCPYGFGNCSPVSTPIITVDFTGDFAGIYDNIFTTGNDPTSYNFWNSPESYDPFPAKWRGLYFIGLTHLKGIINLSHTLSFGAWAYLISGSWIGYTYNNFNLNSNGSFQTSMQTYDGSYQLLTVSMTTPLKQWSYISYSFGFSNGVSTITPYLNNVQGTTGSINNYVLRTTAGGYFYLGNGDFNGFISYFQLWGVTITDFSTALNYYNCNIGSDIECLWNCDYNYFFNGVSCQQCSALCQNGCVRANSWSICETDLCQQCSSFSPNSCTHCKPNANLINSICECNIGFYWNIDNESCELCDASCKSCTSSNYLDCLACADGLYETSGICLSSCPLGYSLSVNKCVQIKEKIFDLDLNTLQGVIYDKASSIPVITGSTKRFYPNYEADDTIPAYLRGFYFNGLTSILRLPEYSNYASPKLVIAPTFTISIWLNPESSTSAIISKNDISSSTSSTLWAMYIMNSRPSLSLSINSFAILYYCQASLKDYEWNHVSFTLEITKDGNSMISCYIKAAFDSSGIVGYGFFNDKGSKTTMTIGAQTLSNATYNFYKGFIYTIQIFNAIESISKLSTTTCTESCGACPTNLICIPNCKINEFWTGPSYNTCYQCNVKCKKSCRDWRPACSLCDNLLCEICTDYSEAGCETCKENAINPNSCICDTDFVLDPSNNSTCIEIQNGGFKGSDGNFYACPNLCTSCESQIKCTTCVQYASLLNDLCYCNLGYNGISNCTWVSFSAKLTVLNDNSLYLTFTDTLANNLEASDFTINIKNHDVSWTIEKTNNTNYYITLSFDEVIPKGTLATLLFLNLTELRSISNGILTTSEISVSLNYYDPSPYSSPIAGAASQGAVSSQAAVSVAAVLSIFSLSASSLWTLMNTLQYLSYLTLSGIPLSTKIRTFLNSLNSFSIFPNIFSYFVDEDEGAIPYSQAIDFGYDTDLILINQGNDFTLILVSISVFPAVFLFSRCSYRWFGKKFNKTLKSYKYSFYLRFWIQCYLELGAAASVGLATFSFKNHMQFINIMICTSVLLLLFLTPPLFFLFSYKNKNRILSREKSLYALFSTLWEEFQTGKGLLSTQYYLLFFSRRFIYIISLVFLRDYPETEVTVNIVLSFLTVLYLFFYWPFEDPILQISNLLTEILVLIVMCATSFYLFNLEQEIVTGVESAIIASVALAMATQFLTSLAIFSRTLYQVISRKLEKSGITKKKISINYN